MRKPLRETHADRGHESLPGVMNVYQISPSIFRAISSG